MEQQGELIFVPFGGGKVSDWEHRLAPLGKPEFHLYDHELPPETEYRIQAAEAINARPNCRAVITRKRSLENFLHPQAIFAAANVHIFIDDFAPVAELAARKVYQLGLNETPWELLPKRSRSRMAYRCKRWLNTAAVDQMTSELLTQRDPTGEMRSWMKTIGQLAAPILC